MGQKDSVNDNGNNWLAIVEVILMIFITTMIPSLIKLGHPPESFGEIYIEVLIATLASAYAYMRIRGISTEVSEEED